jgi:hypothetical protein
MEGLERRQANLDGLRHGKFISAGLSVYIGSANNTNSILALF